MAKITIVIEDALGADDLMDVRVEADPPLDLTKEESEYTTAEFTALHTLDFIRNGLGGDILSEEYNGKKLDTDRGLN